MVGMADEIVFEARPLSHFKQQQQQQPGPQQQQQQHQRCRHQRAFPLFVVEEQEQ